MRGWWAFAACLAILHPCSSFAPSHTLHSSRHTTSSSSSSRHFFQQQPFAGSCVKAHHHHHRQHQRKLEAQSGGVSMPSLRSDLDSLGLDIQVEYEETAATRDINVRICIRASAKVLPLRMEVTVELVNPAHVRVALRFVDDNGEERVLTGDTPLRDAGGSTLRVTDAATDRASTAAIGSGGVATAASPRAAGAEAEAHAGGGGGSGGGGSGDGSLHADSKDDVRGDDADDERSVSGSSDSSSSGGGGGDDSFTAEELRVEALAIGAAAAAEAKEAADSVSFTGVRFNKQP
jgi:hypothetical protein